MGERPDDRPEPVTGEVVEDVPPEELPPWVIDKIAELLEDFKQTYGIEDLHKCAGVQWRACCQFVGRWFQRSDVLRDKERERMIDNRAKCYKAERVAALVPVWAELCGAFNHPPLHGDFIAFTGVSHEWVYDTERSLTSSSVDLLQKVKKLEEEGLSAAVADHRQNPVGRMFLLKAKHGYRETSEIVHTSEKKTIEADALPRLGTKGE